MRFIRRFEIQKGNITCNDVTFSWIEDELRSYKITAVGNHKTLSIAHKFEI